MTKQQLSFDFRKTFQQEVILDWADKYVDLQELSSADDDAIGDHRNPLFEGNDDADDSATRDESRLLQQQQRSRRLMMLSSGDGGSSSNSEQLLSSSDGGRTGGDRMPRAAAADSSRSYRPHSPARETLSLLLEREYGRLNEFVDSELDVLQRRSQALERLALSSSPSAASLPSSAASVSGGDTASAGGMSSSSAVGGGEVAAAAGGGAQSSTAAAATASASSSSSSMMSMSEADWRQLQQAFRDHFRHLTALHAFVSLNRSAILETLRARNSTPPVAELSASRHLLDPPILYQLDRLSSQPFVLALGAVADLVRKAERSFADVFGVAAEESRQFLRPDKPDTPQVRDLEYGVGAFTGVLGPLLSLFFVFIFHPPHEDTFTSDFYHAHFPIYRGYAMVVMAVWFWGGALYVLQRYRISHETCLQLDLRSSLSCSHVFRAAGVLSMLWLTSYLLFITHGLAGFGFSPESYPVVLGLGFIILACNPLNMFYRSARTWLAQTLLEIVVSPFSDVLFYHVFVGDFLTSMPKLLSDFEYMLCYYIAGNYTRQEAADTCDELVNGNWLLPLTIVLPLWFRFWQCIRRWYYTRDSEHIANAFKYFFSLVVKVMAAWHTWYEDGSDPDWDFMRRFWFVCYLMSTFYLIFWDVRMDWGLGRFDSKNWGLRDRLTFAPRVYYCILCGNVVLRFVWAATLTRRLHWTGFDPIYKSLLTTILELFRRSVWGVLRLEWEQQAVTKRYRASLASVNVVGSPSAAASASAAHSRNSPPQSRHAHHHHLGEPGTPTSSSSSLLGTPLLLTAAASRQRRAIDTSSSSHSHAGGATQQLLQPTGGLGGGGGGGNYASMSI